MGSEMCIRDRLMVFHSALLISLILENSQIGGIVLHTVLALMAIVLFTLRGRWCDEP